MVRGLLLSGPSGRILTPLLEEGFVVSRDVARSECLADDGVIATESYEADVSLSEGLLCLREAMRVDCDHTEDRASCTTNSIHSL